MKKAVLFCTLAAIVLSSCVKNSSAYKALQAKNDSLSLAARQADVELEQIVMVLNEVEENFRSIKTAENYLSVQSGSTGELSPSARERIHDNLRFVTETLDKNRLQIADLETRLQQSSRRSSQLTKMLDNLRLQLEERTNDLVALREELGKRDREIAGLTENVNQLSDDVKNLTAETAARQAIIDQQRTQLNTAYYLFGTTKELKEHDILLKGQLSPNFDPKHFVRIDDINTYKNIRLYAKKAKLISKHPIGSYAFGKDATEQAELRILNPTDFWSLTKYLVIEVKL
jgi:DNA repair exonuclease SbcCD ATPase subunit